MNSQEAIAIMKNERPGCGEKIPYTESEKCEAYDIAISAIEKQIPKKGIKEKITKGCNKGLHEFYCSVCYEKGNLSNKCNVGDYCSDCGQAIDWSDND